MIQCRQRGGPLPRQGLRRCARRGVLQGCVAVAPHQGGRFSRRRGGHPLGAQRRARPELRRLWARRRARVAARRGAARRRRRLGSRSSHSASKLTLLPPTPPGRAAAPAVKYFNPTTSLCIVRCGREEYRRIWAVSATAKRSRAVLSWEQRCSPGSRAPPCRRRSRS